MDLYRSIAASVLSLAAITMVSAAELKYDWGEPETVACHSVGPGMKYAKIIYPQKPLILWWVEVDLTNEYSKIEQVQSRHAVPDPLRWDVMTHYRENSRPGHQVKVAWNHDFFSYGESVCIGLNISGGEVTWTRTGRSLLAITEDGKAEVFYPNMDTYVTTADGVQVGIDYYNAFNGGLYGDCILYNRFNSKTLTEEGRYIGLQPLDKWTVNGDPVRCKVTKVGSEPLATSADGQNYVLYLRNAKLNALDGHVAVGDIVTVTQNFTQSPWGNAPRNILNAFHGYPSIVHDGVLHEGEYNNFENGREYEKSSRVMAGISQDKTKLHIVTTEMSGNSLGVDCIELAAWLVEKGAWDVVNFDSGGSAAIVIDEVMLNKPGRGTVRPVQDAALAVSLAPEDNTVDHLTFSVPNISPRIITRVPLRVMAFNRYDEVLEDDLSGCEFECVPSSLGYVDEDGIFHVSSVCGTGHIYARKDGKEAVLDVDTKNIESIAPKYTSLLIDNFPHQIVGIQGVASGNTVDVDPGAFEWTSAPEGIVSVSEDGMITGLSNGKTRLHAAFNEISFDIDVTVEIADKTKTLESFGDLENMEMKTSSAVKNITFDHSDLPAGWSSGAVMNFDLNTGRGSYIRLTPEMQLYSLPDAISLHMCDRDGILTQVAFAFVDAQGERIAFRADAVKGDYTYFVPFNTEDEKLPLFSYPLKLSTVTCYVVNKSIPDTQLAFGSIDAYYPGYNSGIESVAVSQAGRLSAAVAGETLSVGFEASSASSCMLELYSVTGRRVAAESFMSQAGHNSVPVDIKDLPTGIYILSLRSKDFAGSTKVVLR